jgi:hypothetical protein
MDISKRTWQIKTDEEEILGPFGEEEFQKKLRDGDIPVYYHIKSNYMNSFEPLLSVISKDTTFKRKSTLPPPPPSEEE